MKVKDHLLINIPAPGKGLKSYEMFGINKGRSKELKNLLDKKTIEMMKPVTDLIDRLPKQATPETKDLIQEALDGIVLWTAPRKFIEVMSEIDVRNLQEANYVVFAFTLEMFNRMSTNQNMAVEINNLLKGLKMPEHD